MVSIAVNTRRNPPRPRLISATPRTKRRQRWSDFGCQRNRWYRHWNKRRAVTAAVARDYRERHTNSRSWESKADAVYQSWCTLVVVVGDGRRKKEPSAKPCCLFVSQRFSDLPRAARTQLHCLRRKGKRSPSNHAPRSASSRTHPTNFVPPYLSSLKQTSPFPLHIYQLNLPKTTRAKKGNRLRATR